MKKKICMLLSVIMIVSIVSCGETGNEVDKETENSENNRIDITLVTAKTDPVGSIWLHKTGEGGGGSNSAAAYGVSTSRVSHSFDELKDNQKVFGTKRAVLQYKGSHAYLKSKGSAEFGSFYSITDDYISEDQKTNVSYLHGTDIVCQYHESLSNGERRGGKDSLTNASLEKKAYEFLQTLYSKDLLANLSCTGVEYNELMDCVYVNYRRYIEGYATDESIMLMLTNKGVPFGMNADNIGKYNYTDPVTKEDLDQAKEVLLEKVASLGLPGLSHSEEALMLTTDTSGKVYLETWFTFTVGDEGEKMMESLYVNVN